MNLIVNSVLSVKVVWGLFTREFVSIVRQML